MKALQPIRRHRDRFTAASNAARSVGSSAGCCAVRRYSKAASQPHRTACGCRSPRCAKTSMGFPAHQADSRGCCAGWSWPRAAPSLQNSVANPRACDRFVAAKVIDERSGTALNELGDGLAIDQHLGEPNRRTVIDADIVAVSGMARGRRLSKEYAADSADAPAHGEPRKRRRFNTSRRPHAAVQYCRKARAAEAAATTGLGPIARLQERKAATGATAGSR